MEPLPSSSSIVCFSTLFLLTLQVYLFNAVEGATFTFVNKCGATVWPGMLSNAGSPPLASTGFELPSGTSRSFQAPASWSGRFWGRTGCFAGSGGAWTCATGDCGSGQVECNGSGATPPATLAEFTLAASSSGQDFYDVSLVDGYNLPVGVEAGGWCPATGCMADLNRQCPAELKVGTGYGEACRSACDAFNKPEYCCSGAYANPTTCRPSVYSQAFKAACPKSYSYAFDDPTSTFTCRGGADYVITFCPGSTPSQKSSRDSSSTMTPSSSSISSPNPASSSSNPSPQSVGGVMLGDNSWLADLATGDATAMRGAVPFLKQCSLIVSCLLLLLL